MATEGDIGWAAGIFEGEGCFYCRRWYAGKTYQHAVVTVTMTDEDVVRRFSEVVGCGTIRTRHLPSGKTGYTWKVASFGDVEHVVRLLYPYLGKRRRAKADEVLLHLEARVNFKKTCKRGHPRTPENSYFAPKSGIRHCAVCRREAYGRRLEAAA